MTTLEILIAARALIKRPENWTKFINSRATEHGMAYCAEGALYFCNGAMHNAKPAWLVLRQVIGGGGITTWNDEDERTHLEVLAAFDAAIALERSRQQSKTDISVFRNILNILAQSAAQEAA